MTIALVASGALFAETTRLVTVSIREATGIKQGAASGEMLAWLAWLNPQYYAHRVAHAGHGVFQLLRHGRPSNKMEKNGEK